MPARRPILLAALLFVFSVARAAGDPQAVALRAVTLRVGEPLPAARSEAATDALRIVHLDHAPIAADRAAIAAAGGEILAYLPANAYLLRAEEPALARLAALAGVDLLVDYRPEWRLAPELSDAAARAAGTPLALTLSFAPGTPITLRADQAIALGATLSRTSERAARPRLWLSAPAALLPALAALPGLLWVEAAPVLADRLERVKWIVQSGVEGETPIWDHGLRGEGQILGHIDSQLNATVCWFADPEGDPFGENHRKIVYRGPEIPHSTVHGTHTAGILTGDAEPISGNLFHRGIAWKARMAHSEYLSIDYDDFYGDLEQHHLHGARVHTNSWGSSVKDYNELCVDLDAFSFDYEESVVLFAVANGGVGSALGSPENAKSAVAVGATYVDGLVGDSNLHYSGGSGPTLDGRRKPELFAPGYNIQAASGTTPCGLATIPGTSMACPAVAGGTALIRQYLTEGFYPSGAAVAGDSLVPSGALLRALLMNATLPMDSLPAGYPNDVEGWGRLVLDEALYFAGDSRELWLAERRNAQGLETGELFIYRIEVESAAEPLAVTMAFTDPPGALGAAEPVVNDLDLELRSPSGLLYLGNGFDSALGASVPGGTCDPLNTVERALIASPEPGAWEIRVRARAVPMGPQGYGLAVNGDLGESVFAYLYDPAYTVVANSYPSPFLPGAGERAAVTLRFELRAVQPGSLTIYDIAGRRVRELAKGEQFQAGTNERGWDGRDDAGEPAASGIYFAQLQTAGGGRSRAVRIVLIR